MHSYGMNGGWDGNVFWPWLPVIVGPLFFLLVIWSLLWQALGMWHSARRGEWIWFVVFLLIHTLGILEIIYLFAVAKLTWAELFGKKEHRP